jgi:DNA-binding LacI/PurR family transcriptional regulator
MQPVAQQAMKMQKKSVQTITDIARLAKVSKSTVSRALNDSPLIGEETKVRIRAIARQNNFQINIPARQLSMQQSRTVAFVTCAYHKDFSMADLFSLEIMGGVSNGLYAKHFDMLVLHVDPNDTEWAHKYLDTGRVDGFILMTSIQKQEHILALLAIGAPFIVWGIPQPGFQYCSVMGDNVTGGRLAAEHLIRSGRKRMGFLGGPSDELEVQQRFDGFKSALHGAGMKIDPALIAYGDYSDTSGAEAILKLIEQAPDMDAVFINSDLMAAAAMDALRSQGRNVPEDVAVVGYDDLSIAQHSNPPLTTIRQNIPMAGKMLAQNLIKYLETEEITNVTLPVELVIRKSS